MKLFKSPIGKMTASGKAEQKVVVYPATGDNHFRAQFKYYAGPKGHEEYLSEIPVLAEHDGELACANPKEMKSEYGTLVGYVNELLVNGQNGFLYFSDSLLDEDAYREVAALLLWTDRRGTYMRFQNSRRGSIYGVGDKKDGCTFYPKICVIPVNTEVSAKLYDGESKKVYSVKILFDGYEVTYESLLLPDEYPEQFVAIADESQPSRKPHPQKEGKQGKRSKQSKWKDYMPPIEGQKPPKKKPKASEIWGVSLKDIFERSQSKK